MADRSKSEDQIKQLKAQGIYPYSISKLNTIDNCLREAYYSYRSKDKRERVPSIYGVMGGQIHEVLEHIYNGEADKSDLLVAMKKELANADLVDVNFPKDFRGNETIRNNWIADMTHFCEHFEKLPGDGFTTEEFAIYKVDDNRYMIGYIDLIQLIDKETKTVDIYDFKTSSQFNKKDLLHHGRQLIVYGLALEQAGYEVRNLAWIMLKYVKITFEGYARINSKKKTTIEKIVRRGQIAQELAAHVERALYEEGYSELDVELILADFKANNSIDVLPEKIRDNFHIEQYIQYYEFSNELKAEAIEYINKNADIFEEHLDKPENEWEAANVADKSQTFYCTNLCSHRDICPELMRYKLSLDLKDTDNEDLF